MILNLTADEIRAVANAPVGTIPNTVIAKAAVLLRPAEPITGQLDLIDELAKEQRRAAHQRP